MASPETNNTSIYNDFSTAGGSIGSVLYTDSLRHVAIVSTPDGKISEYSFASMVGSRGEGASFTPPSGQGWRCALTSLGGETFITSFLPPSMDEGSDDALNVSSNLKDLDVNDSITGTYNQYRAFTINESRRRKNYRSNRYTDHIPGDLTLRGLEGNMIGALRGGVNISKVSELNQIIQFVDQDLIRMVARNFELFTSMGVFAIRSVNGGTFLEAKLSSNRPNSPKSNEEDYEILMKLGHIVAGKDESTYVFTFEYKTPGKDSFLIAMGTDGALTVSYPKDHWLDARDEMVITAGKNMGIFAAKNLDMDANERLTLEAGTNVQFDAEGNIGQKDKGKSFEATKDYAKLGSLDKMEVKVSDDKVLAGKTEGHKAAVTRPHLDDYYNKLCNGIGDLLFAPMTGDLGIPIPIAVRSGQFKFATSLYTTLLDLTNYTKEFEAT